MSLLPQLLEELKRLAALLALHLQLVHAVRQQAHELRLSQVWDLPCRAPGGAQLGRTVERFVSAVITFELSQASCHIMRCAPRLAL